MSSLFWPFPGAQYLANMDTLRFLVLLTKGGPGHADAHGQLNSGKTGQNRARRSLANKKWPLACTWFAFSLATLRRFLSFSRCTRNRSACWLTEWPNKNQRERAGAVVYGPIHYMVRLLCGWGIWPFWDTETV